MSSLTNRNMNSTHTVINEYSSVLSVKEGLNLIRKFARERIMTIKVYKGSDWRGDEGDSYLFKKAWQNLCRPIS